jgi:nicotinamidase-related amidase
MEHAFGLDIPLTLAEVCHPQRTALIVYDMQVGIVSQIADGHQVVERVRGVLEAARSGGYRVFFTRHMSLPNEVAGVIQLRTAMAWQHVDHVDEVKPAFLRDTPGFQIASEIPPLASEGVIDKITMSAFEGTFLDIAFRDCGINSFVIAGIALEVGVEPTVRQGMDLGYIPVLVRDACGHGNSAAAQRSLAALAFAGGSIQCDCAAINEVLRRSSEQRMVGQALRTG